MNVLVYREKSVIWVSCPYTINWLIDWSLSIDWLIDHCQLIDWLITVNWLIDWLITVNWKSFWTRDSRKFNNFAPVMHHSNHNPYWSVKFSVLFQVVLNKNPYIPINWCYCRISAKPVNARYANNGVFFHFFTFLNPLTFHSLMIAMFFSGWCVELRTAKMRLQQRNDRPGHTGEMLSTVQHQTQRAVLHGPGNPSTVSVGLLVVRRLPNLRMRGKKTLSNFVKKNKKKNFEDIKMNKKINTQ